MSMGEPCFCKGVEVIDNINFIFIQALAYGYFEVKLKSFNSFNMIFIPNKLNVF